MITPFARRTTALVAAAALAAACGSGDAGDTEDGGSAAEQQSPVRISVGVDPAYAPMFVAEHEGMFEEAGLDVELVKTEGGAAGAQNVSAGATELSGNADATALSVMANNPQVRALGVFQESDRYLEAVLAEGTDPSEIDAFATGQGLLMFMTLNYLQSVGVDPADVELVDIGPPDMPTLLGRGEVDGFIAFDPWVTQGVENGGEVVATSGEFGVSYVQWIIANDDWLSENEELAGRVFAVIAEASASIAEDPEAAAEAVEASIDMPAEEALEAMSAIDFGARGFTDEDLEQSTAIAEFLEEQGAIEPGFDVEDALLVGWYEEHVP